MRIYLIGMPASGKSTFGKKLSEALNLPLIDTDTLIEEQEGIDIPTIFSQKGEAHFRLLEADILRGISVNECIISTGGGMPCFHDNMEYIKQAGRSVFLDVPVTILAKRALSQIGSRPLLAGQSEEEALIQLEEKLQVRLPFYQQADLIFEYPDISVERVMGWKKND